MNRLKLDELGVMKRMIQTGYYRVINTGENKGQESLAFVMHTILRNRVKYHKQHSIRIILFIITIPKPTRIFNLYKPT